MNTSTLVKQFKTQFESETGIKIDFRKHAFLNNQYGATPCFNYDFAQDVVTSLYNWAHSFIEENEVNYPHFSGWQYNTSMECEKLRSTKLQALIEGVCESLSINFVAENSNNILEGIDSQLIENARNQYFAESHLEKFKSSIGKVNYAESFKYFMEKFKSDLHFYKQEKHSGYNCIALFKNVSIVGIGDFMTAEGKKIKTELELTEKFETYSIFKLKKVVLEKKFKNIWDERCRFPNFKPSAEEYWKEVEKNIFA
jgi:hypothetical protein